LKTLARPKTQKIFEAHAKLTSVVGRFMAETGKTNTYCGAIEAFLNKCVLLSPEHLDEAESFIKENVELGCATREEFIQGAISLRSSSQPEEKTSSSTHSTKRTPY
jgi:hypothetical protein